MVFFTGCWQCGQGTVANSQSAKWLWGKRKMIRQNCFDFEPQNHSLITGARRCWQLLCSIYWDMYLELSPLNAWAPFYQYSQGWSSEQSVKESLAWQSYRETAALLTAFHCPRGIFVLHRCRRTEISLKNIRAYIMHITQTNDIYFALVTWQLAP